MFNNYYNDWNHRRIKAILKYYGHEIFQNKSLLDLGTGYGAIGGSFARLGALVHCVDARKDHIAMVQKQFPHIKTAICNLDHDWPYPNKKFDFIFDLGLLCHLKHYKQHLEKVCASTEHLILETEVCDSIDNEKVLFVEEHQSLYDRSFGGVGAKPSASHIEKILTENGMSFIRVDSSELNTGPFKYDWAETNNGNRSYGLRRMWFARKSGEPVSVVKQVPQPLVHYPQLKVLKEKVEEVREVSENKDNFRVALCVSGHMRSFHLTYHSLARNLFRHQKCDVFISTWASMGAVHRHHDARLVRQSVYDVMDKVKRLYNPVELEVEPFMHFPFTKILLERNIENRDLNGMISMVYKIYKANQLKKKYENENNFKYDCVIRYRPDLDLGTPLLLKDYDLSKVILPKIANYYGINDQFAFSNSQNMDIYSDLFHKLEGYLLGDKDQWIDPERLMKYNLTQNNIPILNKDINYILRRG